MKHFIALNTNSSERVKNNYILLAKKTLITSKRNTTLDQYVIYDGTDENFLRWLEANEINVIRYRSRLFSHLKSLADRTESKSAVDVGSGAFLRADVPIILREHIAQDDDYVLYTDCDVMFLSDVNKTLPTQFNEPFAVAPEFEVNNYSKMNTGVMIMNIKSLYESYWAFLDYCKSNLEYLVSNAFDQTAYINFYSGEWVNLKPEYNWKPYWGYNSEAKIIHFHGPKPHHQSMRGMEGVKPLERLMTNAYDQYVGQWQKIKV